MNDYYYSEAYESGERFGSISFQRRASEYQDYLDEYFWPDMDKKEDLKTKLFNFLMERNQLGADDKMDEYDIKDLYDSCSSIKPIIDAVKEISELLEEEHSIYVSDLDL
jgi:hypothetical protein